MIPDAASIARRRHIVTIAARAIIVLCAGWVAWHAAVSIGNTLEQLYQTGPGSFVGIFVYFVSEVVPLSLLILAMVILHAPLVRWIVPIPAKHPGCPKCGYSLKDLKSPICPECGTSLRG